MNAPCRRQAGARIEGVHVRAPGWGWLPATLRRPAFWRIVAAFAIVGPLIGGAPYAIFIVTVPFIYLFGFVPALLAGLIAQLCDVTLQDDIADAARRLLQRGQDLIAGGACHDRGCQTRAAPRTAAASAAALASAVANPRILLSSGINRLPWESL